MPDPLVIDTHVFIRSLVDGSEYRDVFNTMIRTCDHILVNERIVEEYIGQLQRAGAAAIIAFPTVVTQLKSLNKWRETGNHRVREDVGSEQDRRFIGAALSGSAKFLVPNDRDLRTTTVLQVLRRSRVQVVYPDEYLSLRSN